MLEGGDRGGSAATPTPHREGPTPTPTRRSTPPSPTPTPIQNSFSLWIPTYNQTGNISFKWDRVNGAKSYRLVGTYGNNAPLSHYYDIASTTNTSYTVKSSKVFTHGKNIYYFQVLAYKSDRNYSSNLANIIRK